MEPHQPKLRGRASTWVVAGAGSLLGVCLGTLLFFTLRGNAEPPRAPQGAPVSTIEPGHATHRRPILPLRNESVTPASESVGALWAAKNRDAIAALDAGDLEKAVALFEECLAGVPEAAVFSANLAEALARLAVREDEHGRPSERSKAIEHMARATQLAPGREDIARRLEQMKRLARSEEGFTVETSEHFELSYDGERSELLWSSFEIIKTLESAYQDLGELFGMWPVEGGRARIRVVLYAKSGFHEATGMGHWAAGVFDGSVRVPLEDLGREKETLERVLRHEIAHAFVKESGGAAVPGWLNEGLAQWLETKDLLLRARGIKEARQRLAGKTLIPLEQMAGSLAEMGGEEQVSLAYAEALALCGWIERNFGERVLFEMVAASRKKDGWREAYRNRTGSELDAALSELAR
jgi:tetratricopeptide (TPR) repeat protein